MAWLQLALIVGLVRILAIAMRRRNASTRAHPGIDAGAVSESWLAQQRGSRTDRLSS
jgi:hypothetical protein